jgi:hypothetical protein
MAAPSVTFFGPLDTVLGPYMGYVVLALAVVNIATRALAHRSHVSQVEEGGADELRRHPAHVASNVLLVLASFYYLTLHHHSGVVAATLIAGLFITDFFEFEARKVEARRGIDLERPKGAIAASVLVLMYVSYVTLFFIVKPIWSAIV